MTCSISYSLFTKPNALRFLKLGPLYVYTYQKWLLHCKPPTAHITKCIVKVAPNILNRCIYESGIPWIGRKWMTALIIKCIFVPIDVKKYKIHICIHTDIISICWLICAFNAVYFVRLAISLIYYSSFLRIKKLLLPVTFFFQLVCITHSATDC